MKSGQRRTQYRRDLKRVKAILVPMFRQMQVDLRNPEYTKEDLDAHISDFIDQLEAIV